MSDGVSVELTIDPTSGVPPFEQLRSHILQRVADGTLQAGDRLPAVRTLAGQLGIAAGTVARAYKELEAAGVVITARRHGTVIASAHGPRPAPVLVAAGDYVRAGRAAGLSDEELLEILRGVLNR